MIEFALGMLQLLATSFVVGAGLTLGYKLITEFW